MGRTPQDLPAPSLPTPLAQSPPTHQGPSPRPPPVSAAICKMHREYSEASEHRTSTTAPPPPHGDMRARCAAIYQAPRWAFSLGVLCFTVWACVTVWARVALCGRDVFRRRSSVLEDVNTQPPPCPPLVFVWTDNRPQAVPVPRPRPVALPRPLCVAQPPGRLHRSHGA